MLYGMEPSLHRVFLGRGIGIGTDAAGRVHTVAHRCIATRLIVSHAHLRGSALSGSLATSSVESRILPHLVMRGLDKYEARAREERRVIRSIGKLQKKIRRSTHAIVTATPTAVAGPVEEDGVAVRLGNPDATREMVEELRRSRRAPGEGRCFVARGALVGRVLLVAPHDASCAAMAPRVIDMIVRSQLEPSPARSGRVVPLLDVSEPVPVFNGTTCSVGACRVAVGDLIAFVIMAVPEDVERCAGPGALGLAPTARADLQCEVAQLLGLRFSDKFDSWG